MTQWYIIDNGEKKGPFTKEELMNFNFTPDTLVHNDEMRNYVPISEIPELSDLISTKGSDNFIDNFVKPEEGKYSKKLTAIFCLLGGLHGLHYAYLDKTQAALYCIIALYICLITSILILPLLIILLWGAFNFVNALMIFIMSQEKFEDKFVNTDKKFPIAF